SIATMELAEFLFVFITKKDIKAFKMQNCLSALISAIIYSLIMPTNPGWETGMGYWIIPAGAALGIILGKLLFGGTGNNIFNPADLGMVIARLSWGGLMSNGELAFFGSDVTAGATALTYGSTYANMANVPLLDLFLGRVPSALGEGFKIAILIGLVYLLIRKTIDWRTFCGYCGTFIVLMMIAGIFVSMNTAGLSWFQFVGYEVLAGGFLFGAVYMITDPVTGPISSPARVIFGVFGAMVAVFIRLYTNSPEGVGYSILFANMIAPVLDYPSWSSSKWKKWHFITLGVLALVGIGLACLASGTKGGFVA
ncbi:MAG: RnfABCDGE type electron transport complex subunit D, partial [Bacilli bacterium]|nr:RnfABCDGE type electron transport complex subunit D [Bacilli bacterium]